MRPAFEEYFTRCRIEGDYAGVLPYDTLPRDDNSEDASDGCYRLLVAFTIEMDDVCPTPIILEGVTSREIGPGRSVIVSHDQVRLERLYHDPALTLYFHRESHAELALGEGLVKYV